MPSLREPPLPSPERDTPDLRAFRAAPSRPLADVGRFDVLKDRFDQAIEQRSGSPYLPLAGALCLVPMFALIVADLAPHDHVVLDALLIAATAALAYLAPSWRLAVVWLSVAVSGRYLYWRFTDTLSVYGTADTIAAGLLLYAETYAFVGLLTGYFQSAILRRHRPPALVGPESSWPSVDIFVPTYNEPVDVLRATVAGALRVDYPHKTVWLLDDGKRPEMAELAASLGCRYLTRPDNSHAKAGNLNHALKQSSGELVAIFDADHVPTRIFLRATVGFFQKNPRLALVQTPHHFYNDDPFVRNLRLGAAMPPEQHLFYHLVQLGNDFWNSAFFCGSCAVLRRSALVEVGGIAVETVTEDAHTSLKLHARQWDSLYLDIPLAAGLATESYSQHIGQRIRWARGMAQIFRLDNPLTKRGLSLAQRINYFSASFHFFFGLSRLIFVLIPPLYLLFDIHPVDANVRGMILYALPHLALIYAGARLVNRNVRYSTWPEVFELAVAPYTTLVTLVAVVAPKRGKFNVTNKGETVDSSYFDSRNAMPLILIEVLAIAALLYVPIKLHHQPLDAETVVMVALWNFYNVVLLGAAIAVAWERPQRRRHHRLDREAPVTVLTDRNVLRGQLRDLSMGGARFKVPGSGPLPAQVRIALGNRLPGARSTMITVDVIRQWETGTGRLVTGTFADTSPEAQRAIADVLFSGPSSWIGDQFAFDQPLRAFLQVALTPAAALLNYPPWIEKLRHFSGEGAALVPSASTHRCPRCSASASSPLESACTRCGFELPAAPVPASPARHGVSELALPVTMLALGAGLLLGIGPVESGVAVLFPTELYFVEDPLTRGAALHRAMQEIRDLLVELTDAADRAQGVDLTWTNRLNSTMQIYQIYGATGAHPRLAHVETGIHAVVLELAAIERLQRGSVDVRVIRPRLAVVDQKLKELRDDLANTR